MKRIALWLSFLKIAVLSIFVVLVVVLPKRPSHWMALEDYEDPTEDWVFELESALEPFRIGAMNMAAEQAASIFTDDFAGVTPFDHPYNLQPWGPFEIGVQAEGLGDPRLRAEEFFARFAQVSGCVIKVLEVAPGRDQVTLSFDLDVIGLDGLNWEFKGTYQADLQGLKISGLKRLSSRVSRATRPIFVDEDVPIVCDTPSPHCVGNIRPEDLGGLAMGDFDGDGYVDLVVPRCGRPLLLHNERGEGFSIREIGPNLYGAGALALDYDNDGRLDILIMGQCNGKDGCSGCGLTLLRNKGDGTFEDVTEKAGLKIKGFALAACAADIDGDGYLDIFVVFRGTFESVKSFDLLKRQSFIAAQGMYPNLLFHNNRDGTFTEIGAKAGITEKALSLACTFTDVNDDGLPDLYVVNDYGPNSLYINKGGCSFELATNASNVADPGFGMGVAVGDANGDGRLDLYVSNMYSTAGNRVLRSSKLPEDVRRILMKFAAGNTLLVAKGGGKFEQVEAGVSRAGWAWGCQFVDVNNDGYPDIHVANGFISGPSRKDL